ncbi:rho guanine nucleotide exchange factor 1-like isoform X1 [Sapajus apella]|uniref:Rho guanine nucleotide exchange factor 1-like isoform X1 n=1 Tax=Sapajus apella TaxID=9515 RepID=A0A6J3FHY5_SAPAP|nr:rho guanine nucleotide exchange factor 1-like isoform X1 [Sapajus apella]
MRPATSTPAEPREMEDVAGGVAPGPLRVGVPISIIGAEDEDFENELEANSEEQNSQFQSLEQVKRRPAHLMALLQHVALQFEPGPLPSWQMPACSHLELVLGRKLLAIPGLGGTAGPVLETRKPPHAAHKGDRRIVDPEASR